ncbi:reverse transcriptase [Elysia marginata]|uniref:Reverse transcriptase n=1 Tax=Elysia marginata TaxID=1093978 RepID=A0AAV4GRH1_9GAST|nr:reverse transcriptase [Elysia marginata]
MAKATIAMAKCADELALHAGYKDKLTSLTDAMTLLGHTHKSITNLRRELMRCALPYDFKSLCDATTEANLRWKLYGMRLTLVTPNCFMASIGIHHAYFSVPIAAEDQKLLKFEWDNELYEFTCYPNGLSQAPRNFTKLTKPNYVTLHSKCHISTGYLDDSLLIGKSFDFCQQNRIDTVTLFDKLGFVVHRDKSVLEPTQIISL